MSLIRVDDVAPQPWKNGGGVTRELLRLPRAGATEADDWSLRISVADIAADGPFSPFPGVRRHFAVIGGAGVRLRWPDGRVRELTKKSGPFAFDGADAPHCELIDGPTRDLNVMVREGEVDYEVAELCCQEFPFASQDRPFGVFTARHVSFWGPRLDSDAWEREVPPQSLLWSEPGALSVWGARPLDPGAHGFPEKDGWLCLPLVFGILPKPPRTVTP